MTCLTRLTALSHPTNPVPDRGSSESETVLVSHSMQKCRSEGVSHLSLPIGRGASLRQAPSPGDGGR